MAGRSRSGCLSGVAGTVAGLLGAAGGGVTLIVGLILTLFTEGGSVVAAIGALLMVASAVFAAVSAERTRRAARHQWAIRAYRSRLDEIDSLTQELKGLATPDRLSAPGARDLSQKLEQLKARRDEILSRLLELDRSLKERRNRPLALQRERRTLQRRLNSAPEDLRPTLKAHLEAIDRTEAFLTRARTERQQLIADLDRVLYGLRSARAQLVAEAADRETQTGPEVASRLATAIQKDVDAISDSIRAVERMRSEIEDLSATRAKKAAQRLST